jgi:hypothetical protein
MIAFSAGALTGEARMPGARGGLFVHFQCMTHNQNSWRATRVTAATTLIALVAPLVFGGDVIRGFVLAMLSWLIPGTSPRAMSPGTSCYS